MPTTDISQLNKGKPVARRGRKVRGLALKQARDGSTASYGQMARLFCARRAGGLPRMKHSSKHLPGPDGILESVAVGASAPATTRLHPVGLAMGFAEPRQAPIESAATGLAPLSSSGSDSGGNFPPRSVPAINSSGALPLGTKPDFIPK
jgi:hypothetical protein